MAAGGLVSLAGCSSQTVTSQKEASTTSGEAGDVGSSATADVMGKRGSFDVEVVLSDGRITHIYTPGANETPGVGDVAIEKITELVVRDQTLNIDTVSGATITSFAFIGGVATALDKLGESSSEWKKREKSAFSREADLPDSADIVVVGAGGAGITAGFTAATEGKNVVVIEKMGVMGGSTSLSGGEIPDPNGWLQKFEGVEDSPELLVEDMLAGGDFMGDPELVKVIAEGVSDSVGWLTYDVGVAWAPLLRKYGGHSVKRCLVPLTYGGCEMISKLLNRINNFQTAGTIELFDNVKATELVSDATGSVAGVKVEDALSGDQKTISCKAVILATGGFGANVEMRAEYNPDMGEAINATVAKGAMGEGLTMAQAVGADLIDMQYIQTYPICDPENGSVLYTGDFRLDERAILVNEEGKRFVDELQRRDVISKAITEQTGGVAYLLYTQKAEDDLGLLEVQEGEFENVLSRGIMQVGDTLEEACEPFGIDAAELHKTIETWNAYCESGSDPEFNYGGTLNPIEEDGAFYVLKCKPGVHYTMGGLHINPNAEVLDKSGAVIPGLYAVGEVAGHKMGTNRLGTTSMADIFTFGRIAGKNASQLA